MAALKDPDSLADAPDYRDRQFCSLALAGCGAYDGDSRSFGSYEHIVLEEEVRRSIVYGEGIGYPYDWPDIPAYLPRLYTKYYTDEQRRRCTSEQAKRFDTMARVYMDLAYQYGLWTAANVMERGGCSDDGFMDFRAWLVAQGKEVYLAALADPDSLANAARRVPGSERGAGKGRRVRRRHRLSLRLVGRPRLRPPAVR